MDSKAAVVARRALGELGIIVVGVLVAFQVESWRENQELKSRESVQLQALRVDFDENRVILDEVLSRQRNLLAAQRQLLAMIHEGATASPDSIKVLVARSRRFHRFEPVTGAYDALVASGDLRLISDERLVADLASFVGRAGDGYEDEELSTLLRVELINALVSSTEYLSVVNEARRARLDLPESIFAADLDQLLRNSEYASYLTLVHVLERAQSLYFDDLSTRVDAILAQLPG